MVTNYIFTGFGHAAGKFAVTNNDLYKATKNDQLKGFNEQLILQSKNYKEYLQTKPNGDPFDYFVGHKMGFYKRHHVAPWPPTKEHHKVAQTSLDLLIDAVDMALKDAKLDPEMIDSWIVSTVSPHEQAPGIATTIKCFFVKPENQTSAMTLTSGCAGFNKGVRRAIDHFKANPHVKHIMLAHTETMSHFLTQNDDFVSHATFGDAAAAIIFSRDEALQAEGVVAQANYHDILMIDSVGVDKEWTLYMDGGWVKNRAIVNISKVSREVLDLAGWNKNDIDVVVPHQTGNAILHAVAEKLEIPLHKVNQDGQHKYGNVSGATIPLSLSLLKHSGKLTPGMRILCPTAGVGGEFGAFTYVVPQNYPKPAIEYQPLCDKVAVVLFADSALGVQVCDLLLQQGANVIAHANQANEWSMHLFQRQQNNTNMALSVETLNSTQGADNWIESFLGTQRFDYLLNLFSAKESIYGIVNEQDSVQWSALNQHLSRRLLGLTGSTSFVLSHPAEFVDHHSAYPLKELFAGWHGLMGSMAGEAINKGVRTIWYTPGIYEKMTAYMDSVLKNSCKAQIGQKYSGILEEIAERIVKSLYLVKVSDTIDTYAGPLVQRKESFVFRIGCGGK
jgi:3-oxoacyl-[acyl-carrier-protein] synthase-3